MTLCYVYINVLAETPPTTNASVMIIKRCQKCGTTKQSGKPSCCARGGAWFKKCGDAGDTKFDHTWAEGMQACNNHGLVSLLSVEASAQAHEEGTIDKTINATEMRNSSQQYVNTRPTINASDVSTTDGTYCIKLVEITLFASSLLINLRCRH